jgi:four helix bundle protein
LTLFLINGYIIRYTMKKESVLREKSSTFSLTVVRICQFLREKKKQGVLYNQFKRSGTAIAALISEAEFAHSNADFINKMSIALKVANETDYWLILLFECGDMDQQVFHSASKLSNELISMLVATIRTAKCNQLAK